MKNRAHSILYFSCLSFTFFAVGFFAAPKAVATLGEDSTTVQKDVDELDSNASEEPEEKGKLAKAKGKRSAEVTKKEKYDIHELKTKSGYMKEYVDKSGKVFAVTWKGAQPDLSKIFGRHYDAFSKARGEIPNQGRRSRFRKVETSELTVEYGGHMKNLVGRALLSKEIPDGVAVNEIQ